MRDVSKLQQQLHPRTFVSKGSVWSLRVYDDHAIAMMVAGNEAVMDRNAVTDLVAILQKLSL